MRLFAPITRVVWCCSIVGGEEGASMGIKGLEDEI